MAPTTGTNTEAGVTNAVQKPAITLAGMGPILHPDGVGFRVWAPHADAVSIVGDFNDWDGQTSPMVREDHGHWYGFISGIAPGASYKYRITNGGKTFDRIDPRVRKVTNSVGTGIVHASDFDWQGDSFAMPPWNELVIYETHIGTFNREPGRNVGTFDDYIDRFDHLKALGVNALQIMPIAEFAGDLSWGYNPAHPYAIESAYGGPEGFKAFVREAHRAGFAVIMDVVYNHFGPSDLDLWQFDGWSENEKGGIYFYNDHRSHTPWGDTRPDYGRGEVRSYIRDNVMMWIEEYHVDGLRYDMTLYIRSIDASGSREIPEGWSLTQWINREIHAIKPHAITIAEDLQNNHYLTKPEHQGGAGFSTQWDAGFVHPIRDVLKQSDDSAREMGKVVGALHHRYNGDVFERVVYTESHDEVANGKSRVPSEVNVDDPDSYYAQKRSVLGLALTLTAPGIPMLFQDQEFLEDGWFQDHEELDWSKRDQHDGLIQLTRDLIALRRNQYGVTAGLTGQGIDVFHVNHVDKVIVYRRSCGGGQVDGSRQKDGSRQGDDVIVVANFSHRHFSHYEFGLPRGGTWIRRFSSDQTHYSDDFGGAASGNMDATNEPYDGKPNRGWVELPPYTALIFSQDAPQ